MNLRLPQKTEILLQKFLSSPTAQQVQSELDADRIRQRKTLSRELGVLGIQTEKAVKDAEARLPAAGEKVAAARAKLNEAANEYYAVEAEITAARLEYDRRRDQIEAELKRTASEQIAVFAERMDGERRGLEQNYSRATARRALALGNLVHQELPRVALLPLDEAALEAKLQALYAALPPGKDEALEADLAAVN
ncbi:hypothetical protein [Methylococcus sp. EFPC2]|uniref:hypothetical protein n=1 Tax=Methylococcus sp. EFPC2 TaxID=2812648 RepID=UPI001967E4F5|nr:hypothetical protein [Methylococcus sp. EFPC2]QSA98731.1 hypothetical protein JWZ97_08090 [Methylococcus sp. EFPC2]